MRRRARVDRNHAEIVNALRALGWSVYDASRYGGGFPDLVVTRRGEVRLVEVKTPKGTLTPEQVTFGRSFPVVIVRGVEDAEMLR